jgi:hypothetical protein
MRLSSFSEGPLGIFSPISHFWTVETLVFNTAANTAWLRCTASCKDTKGQDQLNQMLRGVGAKSLPIMVFEVVVLVLL